MIPASEGTIRLERGVVSGFAAANLPVGALATAVAVFLPAHFTRHLGMALATVGTAWMVVRLLDILVDPALGLLIDRTRTSFGRYRVWIAAATPLLMLATYALFEAPFGASAPYLVGWLLIFYLANSVMTLGQSAWGASIARDYNERARLFAASASMGGIAAIAVLLVPVIGEQLGRQAPQAVPDIGFFILTITLPALAWLLIRAPERPIITSREAPFRFSDYLKMVAKPDLARLMAAQLALSLGPGWMSSLYFFFYVDARHFTTAEASALLLIYILAGVAGAPACAAFARRYSKHRALMFAAASYSLGLFGMILPPEGNFLFAVPAMFWCGFMSAGFDLMIRAMLADVGDEVRLETGQDRSGSIFALSTAANKVATAVAIGLTFPLLAWLGYDPTAGDRNPANAIRGLELAFLAGPILFVALGGWCVAGWRLDAGRHAEIQRRLAERDQGPVPQSRNVAAVVTGAEKAGPIYGNQGE